MYFLVKGDRKAKFYNSDAWKYPYLQTFPFLKHLGGWLPSCLHDAAPNDICFFPELFMFDIFKKLFTFVKIAKMK